MNTYQNQIKHPISLNTENNINNNGKVNLTTFTHNQITSNINNTQIVGMVLKNNFMKNRNTIDNFNLYTLNNTTKNINNNKINFNINNNTCNKISEHMEESKKNDSTRTKNPIYKMKSKSYSKNKIINNSNIKNLVRDDIMNLNIINFGNNKKDENWNGNANKNKSKISNSKILKNGSLGNPNKLSIKNKNTLQNQFNRNRNIVSNKKNKKDLIKKTSKENIIPNKEDDIANFILNNVEPLNLNEFKSDFNSEKIVKKISSDDLKNNTHLGFL